ncbi:MAG TPA: Fe-S cluster assembly protein SufD [Myxococcales bacterium]|nr:Fe-S cluster assembly protein SufD [Myxococcales bacterium]HIN86186.1 Fe-S cluster assembly protein SufD [Myxococcales bacterium]
MATTWLNTAASQSEPAWLSKRRKQAGKSFDELGFPTTRLEPWRYTNIKPWVNKDHAVAPVSTLDVETLNSLHLLSQPAARLIFVNGRYAPQLSQGAVFTSALSASFDSHSGTLNELLGHVDHHKAQAMSALNLACFSDGALIVLPKNTLVEAPIELVFVSNGKQQEVTHQRILVSAGEGSMATVVTRHVGLNDSAYFTNTVSEFQLSAGAVIKNVVLQNEGSGALHLSTTAARVGQNANFQSWVASLGAQCARNEIHVALDSVGARTELEGLFLARDSQNLDHYTNVEHTASHTESNELYKGVVDDNAKGTFQARVYIANGATKCATHQLNRNLILSENAEVNTKPQLEIDNDDVQATHGATVGQLEEDALYYMQCRGIPAKEARTLLVDGFVRELAGRLSNPQVKDVVNILLEQALGRSSGIV